MSPKVVAAIGARIRIAMKELLTVIEPGVTVDFIEAIALPVPLYAICDFMGLPRSDRPQLKVWANAVISANDVRQPTEKATNDRQFSEMWAYFGDVLAERRRRPADDVVSQLVTAKVDGEPLTEGTALAFCASLLTGGLETTMGLISCGALALAQHPDQRARLVNKPDRIPDAVEEMLRWVTPQNVFGRSAVEDTLIWEQPIKAGEYVIALLLSANRDEAVYDDPDTFNVFRDPKPRHLAFSTGAHFCFGQQLAKLEARIAFEELLGRFPRYDVTSPVEYVPSTAARKLKQMSVVFA